MPEAATISPFDIRSVWGADLRAAICERCNWRYLLPGKITDMPLCPHCLHARLALLDEGAEQFPYPYPPEMVAPFSVSESALEGAVRKFADGIPYPPQDLNYTAMRSRLVPVYLPMWLVDGQVCATWQADAGFDYQVVSHQEYFNENQHGWQTREVRENRVRWETRVGRLNRTYHNISAPALEDAPQVKQRLGDFRMDKLERYHPLHIENAFVRLPDRATDDAWSNAVAAFQSRAAEECREACEANHIRQYRWSAQFENLNWTLLLLPTYTTYYLDDENNYQPVLIHGQTGLISGNRRASMRRAQRTSFIFLGIALVVFLLGLILGALSVPMPPLAPLAGIAVLVGIVGALLAFIPIGVAWDFNRKQPEK